MGLNKHTEYQVGWAGISVQSKTLDGLEPAYSVAGGLGWEKHAENRVVWA